VKGDLNNKKKKEPGVKTKIAKKDSAVSLNGRKGRGGVNEKGKGGNRTSNIKKKREKKFVLQKDPEFPSGHRKREEGGVSNPFECDTDVGGGGGRGGGGNSKGPFIIARKEGTFFHSREKKGTKTPVRFPLSLVRGETGDRQVQEKRRGGPPHLISGGGHKIAG